MFKPCKSEKAINQCISQIKRTTSKRDRRQIIIERLSNKAQLVLCRSDNIVWGRDQRVSCMQAYVTDGIRHPKSIAGQQRGLGALQWLSDGQNATRHLVGQKSSE